MTNTIDYTHFSDRELNDIVDISINKGGIPLKAVQEHQKRFPKNYTRSTRTVTSDYVPPKGHTKSKI